MMHRDWQKKALHGKCARLPKTLLIPVLAFLAACTVNSATGERQFTALMSPAQENSVGAEQHQQIAAQYHIDAVDPAVVAYVRKVGARVAQHAERKDVEYKFFVLDSPIVNAFALPGGYVYVSRGLLAQANSEAELAAVLGHEVGHITGKHSAERYSRGMLTQIGAMVVSTAVDNALATRALGVGSDLYLKSYSRGQEDQADELGIRYASKAGYTPSGMASFLRSLDSDTRLQRMLAGQGEENTALSSYFSTHPQTADRVSHALVLARQYPQTGETGTEPYLDAVNGLIYGDSPREGFVRDLQFIHTGLDFTFTVPAGFKLQNDSAQVTAVNAAGQVILFDSAPANGANDAYHYLTAGWLKGEAAADAERLTISGKDAATASFAGTVNNRPVTIRLVAVRWTPDLFLRFQLAIPQGTGAADMEALKKATYSLRNLTPAEKSSVKPYRLRLVTALPSDTVTGLSARMAYKDYAEERFRVLNALDAPFGLTAGRRYKIVSY